MLPRQHRLTAAADYTAVLRGGRRTGPHRTRRAATSLLVVYRQDHVDQSRPPRAGFIVSKGVGNSVVRHRVTRRLRHLVAPWLANLPAGTDLVVRAAPEAARASSAELGEALDATLGRVSR